VPTRIPGRSHHRTRGHKQRAHPTSAPPGGAAPRRDRRCRCHHSSESWNPAFVMTSPPAIPARLPPLLSPRERAGSRVVSPLFHRPLKSSGFKQSYWMSAFAGMTTGTPVQQPQIGHAAPMLTLHSPWSASNCTGLACNDLALRSRSIRSAHTTAPGPTSAECWQCRGPIEARPGRAGQVQPRRS